MADFKQKNNDKRIMKIKYHTSRGVKIMSIDYNKAWDSSHPTLVNRL